MKIAVMADIHGNMAFLERAKKIIDDQKIDIVLVCGDIQSEDTFRELDNWSQKVYVAFGNADYGLREMLDQGILWAEHMEIFLDYGVLNIGGAKVAFCHYPKFAQKLAESGRFDVIFYGHSHKPWEEKIGRTILLNPGEIQARDGKPTFALYDIAKMKAELVLLV